MHTERMTVKERMKWYTKFIEEASKLGSVDRTILQRKKGVVEMLRMGAASDDPEGGAVAYMAVQKRDQVMGGSLEKDIDRMERDMALQGTTPEIQKEFNLWFEDFVSSLGTGADKSPKT